MPCCPWRLGIGDTAIPSLVDVVLLRPLPFREPDRLAMVWEDAARIGFPRNTPAPANDADWKAQNRGSEDTAAVAGRSLNLTGDGPALFPHAERSKQIRWSLCGTNEGSR